MMPQLVNILSLLCTILLNICSKTWTIHRACLNNSAISRALHLYERLIFIYLFIFLRFLTFQCELNLFFIWKHAKAIQTLIGFQK